MTKLEIRDAIIAFIDGSGGDTMCSDAWGDDRVVIELLQHAKFLHEQSYMYETWWYNLKKTLEVN